jgi:hypothetical protein
MLKATLDNFIARNCGPFAGSYGESNNPLTSKNKRDVLILEKQMTAFPNA